MNQHSKIVNRRSFLKTTAGLSLALTIAPDALSFIDNAFADAPAAYAPNVWLMIAPDGIITMVAPAAEMGQGSFTSLPVIIAEELDADWSKVRPVFPTEWDDKKFGNPGYNYTFQTSASASVTGYFTSLRIAGAQARRVLLDAVAAKWAVPVGELATEPSVVVQACRSSSPKSSMPTGARSGLFSQPSGTTKNSAIRDTITRSRRRRAHR